jgi:hypothetical protein
MDFSLLASTYKGSATTQLQDLTLTLMNKVQRVFSSNGEAVRLAAAADAPRGAAADDARLPGHGLLQRLDPGREDDGHGADHDDAGNIAGASNPYVVEHTLPGRCGRSASTTCRPRAT